MAITPQNFELLQNYLEEKYNSKFKIEDLFKVEGRNGYRVSSATRSEIYFSFIGTSDVFSIESNPRYVPDFSLYGDSRFDIAYQQFQKWLEYPEVQQAL